MRRIRLVASTLTLFAILLCSSAAHAQQGKGTPTGRNHVVVETGDPTRDGTVIITILITVDSGKWPPSILDEPEFEPGEKTDEQWDVEVEADLKNGRRSYLLEMEISISKDENELTKAIRIRDVIHHVFESRFIFFGLYGARVGLGASGTTPTFALPEVHLWNSWGFTIDVKWRDKGTLERDKFRKISRTFSDSGDLCAVDLEGVPTGGLINVSVDDHELFSLETVAHGSVEELESELALRLSSHPLMLAVLSNDPGGSGLQDDVDFDGQRIVLVENYAHSYMIHVDDPGIDIAHEFAFDRRVDAIGSSYGESTMNSTGQAAQIMARGSLHPGDNYLVVEAQNLPDQFGIFFCGPSQISSPFGEGYRYVGGGVMRVASPQRASEGTVSEVIDTGLLPLELGGGPLHVQYWFRDPQGGGSNFNLSDAITLYLDPPPPIDSDGDGLSDEYEEMIGTNPNNLDSDGDFLDDGSEQLVHQTNPHLPDTDGDGRTDWEEVWDSTDPNDPDDN